MKQHLHDWVFHYNTYTGHWDAATRDNYNALFNDRNNEVLSSGDIWTLIEVINRTNGDKTKMKKLVETSQTY